MDVDGIKITSSFVTIPVGGRCSLSYRRDHGLFRKLPAFHAFRVETYLFDSFHRDSVFGMNTE